MSKIRKATIKLFNAVGEKKGREILRQLADKIEAGEIDEVLARLEKETSKKKEG